MDVEAQNGILDCILGPDQGFAMPASLRMEIWRGHPALDGSVQISYPDYAPVDVSTTANWTTPADGGVKQRDDFVQFPDPTDEADHVGTHWAMFNDATEALYFVGDLGADGLDVSGAGAGPRIRPRIRVADALALIA